MLSKYSRCSSSSACHLLSTVLQCRFKLPTKTFVVPVHNLNVQKGRTVHRTHGTLKVPIFGGKPGEIDVRSKSERDIDEAKKQKEKQQTSYSVGV